jgi:SPP1 gp7 family putative phage head morphogenesis protein
MPTSAERGAIINDVQRNVLDNNASAFADSERLEKRMKQEYRKVARDIKVQIMDLRENMSEWTLAEASKYNRLTGLFSQINEQLSALSGNQVRLVTSAMTSRYIESHLRTIFTMGQHMNVSTSYALLNPKLIREAVNYPWMGDMFSDRIWDNKTLLMKTLRQEITQSLIRGDSMDTLARNINKATDVGHANAVRIARTEMMRITYTAEIKAMKANNIQRIKYLATVPSERTCEICGKSHLKEFPIDEHPILPRHPHCRCTYAPVVIVPEAQDARANSIRDRIRASRDFQAWRATQQDNIPKQEE